MVKRRPETILIDWKDGGGYSETTGRRTEGATNKLLTLSARVELVKAIEVIADDGKRIAVSVKIFADLKSFTGSTIPTYGFVTFRGLRKPIIKIETLQTHVILWV